MGDSSDPVIREWAPSDADAVIAGFIESYNGEPWNDRWTSETAARYLSEFRGMPRALTLVAVLDDRIVGAAYLHARTWQDSSEFYIDEFFVFPTAQRRGVGRALIEAIREQAVEVGADDLTLLTDRRMPAFEFYRSVGFVDATNQAFMVG